MKTKKGMNVDNEFAVWLREYNIKTPEGGYTQNLVCIGPAIRQLVGNVRNEALDAAIEAIEKLQRPIYTAEYRGTLGHAITAIEELREKE